MTTRRMTKPIRALGRLLALALLVTTALGCGPEKLDGFLYDPLKAPAGGYQLSTAVIPASVDVRVPTSDGQVLQGYFVPAGGAYPDVTLIYFHGQSNDVGTSWPRLEDLYPLGCNLLAVDVRGYGLSTGSPDEPGIDLDVKAIWDAAVVGGTGLVPTPVAADHVLVYGRSLGAAFAVQLAAVESGGGLVPPAALITESAFTSVAALVHDGVYVDLPAGFVARASWDNLSKIGAIPSTYVAYYGTADGYVQPRYTEQLVAAHQAAFPDPLPPAPARTASIAATGAGHDDVPEVLLGMDMPEYLGPMQAVLTALHPAAVTPAQ